MLIFTAENHPSTDYPDDEVESDNEYGRNPYRLYRNRNNSDDEEFDQDAAFSDDDEDSRYPWSRKPWMPGHAFHGNDEEDEED